jgi:lipid-A-disaccharide synthase
MLEVMLAMPAHFPDYQFVVGGAPSIPEAFYLDLIGQRKGEVHLAKNQTYNLLSYAEAALVTSGTATLETALFQVPEVVCYKGNSISYWLARRLVNVPFISLVNLIVERELVKELIQFELTEENLQQQLAKILSEADRARLQEGYRELRDRLGQSGASRKAARLMVTRLLEA